MVVGRKDSYFPACLWFLLVLAVRCLLDAGDFPFCSHPHLEQGAEWPFRFHLLLDVHGPGRAGVGEESLGAGAQRLMSTVLTVWSQHSWGADTALRIPALQVGKLRPEKGISLKSQREEAGVGPEAGLPPSEPTAQWGWQGVLVAFDSRVICGCYDACIRVRLGC